MNISHFAAGFSGAGWLPLADAILKATLLFALAAIAALALRRATAAARHLMWALALISALVLPVLSLALPRWQLPLVTVASTSLAVEQESAAQPPLASAAIAPAPKRTHTDPPTAAQSVGARPVHTPAASARLSLPNISWPYALLAVWGCRRRAGAAPPRNRPARGDVVVPSVQSASLLRRGSRWRARSQQSSRYRRGWYSSAASVLPCRWRGASFGPRC